MKTSICIAAHNEGDLLWKTVSECYETCVGFNFEVVVVDDASTDDCIARLMHRFPQIAVQRLTVRHGPSPAKNAAAAMASGEVLVFLDAHCKPEPGAIVTLVRAVVETAGECMLFPAITELDASKWENSSSIVGYGAKLDLFSCAFEWLTLDHMERTGRYFYSPALVGCAFAITKALYQKLWGFDRHMFQWGVEDLDFGLKSWLMGHPILHEPEAVVGHRFRERFETYLAPAEHVEANNLRMLRKALGDADWHEWLEQFRGKRSDSNWAEVWRLFAASRGTAEIERSYLRQFGGMNATSFARRFGLSWPQSTN